jgi:hypothetical protein
MKKLVAALLLFSFFFACEHSINAPAAAAASPESKQASGKPDSSFHNADIIFQTSKSQQSVAIQLATHSRYSHCGILFRDNGKWYAYEAIQPVSKTPLTEWINRDEGHNYVVKRLKNDSVLNDTAIAKMRRWINGSLGKEYDIAFDWTDEKLYCSEFVWKTYFNATGLELGQTKPLGDYDLSTPAVKMQLKKRYGNTIPLNEAMISPGAIYDSELLVTVHNSQEGR